MDTEIEGFSENALKILKARYFKKDEKGKLIETKPSQLFKRVAKYIAGAEKNKADKKHWEERFFKAMMDRDFMPNSPTLTGAGRGLCLSACFVLPVEDSLEKIFETVKNAALVHKEGGGTGFDFSRIRPQGSFVKRTQGIASGPVSFLKVIDAGTEAVKQGGTRRGANMGVLRVDHPDIKDFITMKLDGKTAQNFNISVAVTNKFIQALKDYSTYDLVDPRTNDVVGQLDAREIFDMIVDSAWRNGDPGLVLIDNVNEKNPTRVQGPIRATNPCGEQPLHDYEACNLGSINVSNFFKPDAPDRFDWDRFREIIHMGVRFLDDVIDVNLYPLKQIDQMAKSNRRIGLGIMGFADLLIKKKIKYDTEDALDLGGKIVKFMKEEAVGASQQLAQEKGSFPNIEKSIYKGKKMRNAAVLTIAPTGTISRIAGCSSSIEPIFAFETISKILDGEIRDVHLLYKEWQEMHPGDQPPGYFITAGEIAPGDHIRMQAVFQEYVDSAVSKTINFPREAVVEDIASAYMLAFDMDVKGITVYRDGCRAVQVLNKISAETPRPMDRPDLLPSTTYKVTTGHGRLYITVTHLNGKPFEVFCSIGKSGYSTMADAEAIGRLTSLSLRSGIPAEEIVTQLKGIGGSEPTFHNGALIQSIPDAIAHVLEKETGRVKVNNQDLDSVTCPMCGTIMPDEKCPVCSECGWTKCTGT
ncbi:MAG: adenosylcobalamin-dependent ribonucleoside-diphosphate reductase [Candidatus Aminicenantes bacterium]|nr:MAG: adenosylcobalamin-dependent ribonucleoside-diphosphate reductase [Candidatus Aminicenantes bacterium]